MEISITAITQNRKFYKALVRHSRAIASLEQVALHVTTSKPSFDILQLVFMDRGEDYVNVVGCKRDRLFQVEVSIPSEDMVDFGSASAFVSCIAQRLKFAVRLCGLPQNVESELTEAISHFNVG